MNPSKWTKLGVGALLLTGSIGGVVWQGAQSAANVAYAQGGTTTTPTAPAAAPTPTAPTANTPPAQGAPNNTLNTFLSALATQLNLSVDDLKTQVAAAEKATIEQQVTDGKLTRAQADAIEQRMTANGGLTPFFDGFDGHRGGFGGGPNGRPNGAPNGAPNGQGKGPGIGFRGDFGGVAVLEAEATALKLQPADLSAELASGKTLSDIAKAQSVDETTVKQAIIDATKTQIAREVTDGVITQAQADQILTNLTVDKLDLTRMSGPRGFGPGR